MNTGSFPSRSVRGALWQVKVLVGALLAVAAVTFAVLALQPPEKGTAALVTTREVEAGTQPTSNDVTVVYLPPKAVPEGNLTGHGDLPDVLVPRDIPARTVLTDAMLGVGDEQGIPPGFSRVVTTVEGQHISAGDEVEIWGESDRCSDLDCPIVRLSDDAYVVRVTEKTDGLLATDGDVEVELFARQGDVGKILQATHAGHIHFVGRSTTD